MVFVVLDMNRGPRASPASAPPLSPPQPPRALTLARPQRKKAGTRWHLHTHGQRGAESEAGRHGHDYIRRYLRCPQAAGPSVVTLSHRAQRSRHTSPLAAAASCGSSTNAWLGAASAEASGQCCLHPPAGRDSPCKPRQGPLWQERQVHPHGGRAWTGGKTPRTVGAAAPTMGFGVETTERENLGFAA